MIGRFLIDDEIQYLEAIDGLHLDRLVFQRYG